MIVVTGATGNVGSEVVSDLTRRGESVRAVVRDPSTASLPDGVDAVAGDLSDPATLADAFAGTQAVFLLPGYPGVAEAARNAGVRRIVQLSGGSAASGDQANAVTRYMAAAEAEARATGLELTLLRPAAFMANALRWKPQLAQGDVVRLPFADVPLATVDPADLAAVAAVALAEDGHQSMIYRPTGPESLLLEQQVAVLGEVLGRRLRFEAQPNDEARREMLAAGTPADYVAAFHDLYVNGSIDESTVRPTVQDVTGRPPRTFRQWAEAHVDAFAT